MGMAHRLTMFADYCQLHVEAERPSGDVGEAWSVTAVEDRVAVAGDVVAIGTAEAGEVEVEVEVALLSDAPPLDPQADHVTEALLTLPSDVVVVAGCTEYRPDAARFKLPAGRYVVRATHLGLRTGSESIRLELYPHAHPDFEPRVLVRFVPSPPLADRPANLRTAKSAVRAARQGRVDEALKALCSFADSGDAAAAASVSEILAFRGEWEPMADYAMALLANPAAVYAGNVFADLARLVARAATELADPGLIGRMAAVVPPTHTGILKASLEWNPSAPRSNEPDHDRFAAAVADAEAGKRFRGRPVERAAHLFAVAVALGIDDEVRARWDPSNPGLTFDHAMSTARVLCARGESQRAWEVLEGHVPQWWPVDNAQVAPVELLYDPLLAPLVPPARGEQILRTPRGEEARGA